MSFFRLFVESGQDDFQYEAAHLEMYSEDLPWLDFLTGLANDHPAFDRGMEIRRLFPKVGPTMAA